MRVPNRKNPLAPVIRAALAGALAFPAATLAQENELKIEEVKVTAQKREQSVQDVPVAIYAFTGEQLERLNVQKITDITKLSPNVNVVVQNAMSQHIIIRGVGTNEFFGNAPSSVGVYMDDVTMNSSYMSTLGVFDLERVEVLRGPQNSLFGRNTTGGAVNYISRMPVVGEEANGYAQLMLGRYSTYEARAAATMPVGETAALRVAGLWHDTDGRWNNVTEPDPDYGDDERKSIRATLVFEPSEATRVSASMHLARQRGDAYPQKAFGTVVPDDPPFRLITDEATILGLFNSDIDFRTPVPYITNMGFSVVQTRWGDVRAGGSQRADLDVDGGYLKIEHDTGNFLFTSITAVDSTHGYYEEDNGVSGLDKGPNTEALLIDMDQEYDQFSQEIRFSSSDDTAALRWIAGFYYFNQDSTLAQNIRFGHDGVMAFHPVVNGVPPHVFGFPDTPEGFLAALDAIPNPYANTVSFSIADLEDTSWSVYGHTEYDFSDQWGLTFGLRYTEDDKRNPSYYAGAFDITGQPQSNYYDEAAMLAFAASLPVCQPIGPTNPPFQQCANNNTSRAPIEDQETGGKISIQYRPNDDTMVYGSYSRGFKSGRFDVEFLHTDATPFPQASLDEETLDVWEFGFKATLMDGAMQLNGAVFRNTWKDQQVFNVGSSGPVFSNLPESEVTGAELEMQWVPAANWLVSASVGVLDSKITDASGIDFNQGQGEFQQGHELALVPKFSASFAILKDIEMGANLLTLQLDGKHQAEAKAKYKPSFPIDEYESRTLINARANYNFGDQDQYNFSLSLENLTEDEFCLEKQDLHALVGAYYCVPNFGQMQWFASMRVNF